LKCNKIILSGCSFFHEPFELESINREIIPTYIKEFISDTNNISDVDINKLYYDYASSGKIKNYFDFKLSKQLFKKFNKEVISFTKNGNSNDSILDDVINYLIENKKDTNNIIILGLTSPHRIRRYYDYNKKYIDIKPKWYDRSTDIMSNDYISDEDYKDIGKYYELYLKYFYDTEEHIKTVNNKLDILKFICKSNKHKLLIIDNLLFLFDNDESKNYQNFVQKNKEYLFYFDENNFSWPKFIRSYDKGYGSQHPNSSDISILVDLFKKKLDID
jgi:hypothetical protein